MKLVKISESEYLNLEAVSSATAYRRADAPYLEVFVGDRLKVFRGEQAVALCKRLHAEAEDI